jgi:hypothetical protein
MDVGSRTWDLRDAVIAGGVIAGVVFALIELTGSDIDRQAAQTGYTALAVVLFTAFGSVGVALTRWQQRFALYGLVAATLSLLACGGIVATLWNGESSIFGVRLRRHQRHGRRHHRPARHHRLGGLRAAGDRASR